MSNLTKVLETLSPEQRELLILRLSKAGTPQTISTPEQGVVTGEVPFIQDWFFEQNFPDPHHWNVSTLLEVRQPIDPALLKRVVSHLLLHHDALRLRFVEQDSRRRSFVAAPNEDDVPFHYHDLSGIPGREQPAAVESLAARYQGSLNLSEGPIIRVVFLDLGAGRPGRLLVIIHHLAADIVSLQILLEDLHTAYTQLAAGEAVSLPAKTTSFKELIERCAAYAKTRNPVEDSAYWLSLPWEKVAPLPFDHPHEPADNSDESADAVGAILSAEETGTLLREATRLYSAKTVTMAALVQTLACWTGVPAHVIDLAVHGREVVVEGIDLSRTVGWIAGGTRLVLDIEGADGPGEILAAVDAQIRREEANRMEEGRLAFDSLRYHCGDAEIMKKMQALPRAQVFFNFQGQTFQKKWTQQQPEAALIVDARESKGPSCHPRCVRHLVFEVAANVYGERLVLEWRYSKNLHRRSTVEMLAENYIGSLKSLIGYCQSSLHRP
ncbi:MAG TPA: condensation domain-containing protein [Pyrinomonadaceae bacterium]|nr:condensation domain-containing protein [Pyrinomonadaceae bacterium]